jgi:hypothetical protein
MFQLIGLVVIFWLFLWLFDKGSFSVFGLQLTKERLKWFFIPFVFSAINSALLHWLNSEACGILVQMTLAFIVAFILGLLLAFSCWFYLCNAFSPTNYLAFPNKQISKITVHFIIRIFHKISA